MTLLMSGVSEDNINLQAVYDVPLNITVIIGRASMKVNEVIKLERGSVIELDRKVGEPVEVMINNKIVAKGEIVLLEEDKIGVTIIEIAKSEEF